MLAVVSIFSMLSTIFLTSSFSREIEGYINPPNRLLISEKTGHAWVEIDFDGTRKRLFESDLGSSSYPLPEVLAQIAKTGNFSLDIRQGKIKELAGMSAGIPTNVGTVGSPDVRRGSWNIYRYDTREHMPVDRITVSGNDYYRIKFEK